MPNHKYFFIILLLITYNFNFAQWEQMEGPRGLAKILYADDNVQYAMTDSSRILKSTDNGESWTYKRNGISGKTIIESFAVKGDTLFAATQSGINPGIYKSEDGGNNWDLLTSHSSSRNYIIKIINNRVFISGYFDSNEIIKYSDDYGESWNTPSGLGSDFDKANIITKGNSNIYAATSSKFFFSSDNGSSWELATSNGLPIAFSGFDFLYQKEGETIIGISASFQGISIYSSNDNGNNWTENSSISGISNLHYYNNIEMINSNLYSIGIPKNLGDPFIILTSSDLGNSWSEISSKPKYEAYSIKGNSTKIFLGTIAGVYSNDINTNNWLETSQGIRFNGSIDGLANLGSNLFVLSRIGLGKSSVYPGIFEEIMLPSYENFNKMFATNDALFVYGYTPGLFRSTNEGTSWENVSVNLPENFNIGEFTNNESTIFISGSGQDGNYLYISTDNGNNWNGNLVGQNYISTISEDDGKILAMTSEQILVSDDIGTSWNELDITGLPQGYQFSDGFISGNTVFVIVSDFTNYQVYYTDNLGSNWNLVSGINNYSTLSKIGDNILAGTESGVFISYDNGKNFFEFNEGLTPNIEINHIASSGKYFLAGTIWNAVWFRSLNDVTSINSENDISLHDFQLSQNYPNPFNPTTSINYSIPFSDFVNLKVYDVLGNEVSTIINEYQPIGNYKVEFDASQLTSGVYFYKLTLGNKVITNKMLLLK